MVRHVRRVGCHATASGVESVAGEAQNSTSPVAEANAEATAVGSRGANSGGGVNFDQPGVAPVTSASGPTLLQMNNSPAGVPAAVRASHADGPSGRADQVSAATS